MSLEQVILSAPIHLQSGLRWFAENSGRPVAWSPLLSDGTRLFSTPKGIYKPEGSVYALSVRQTLKSPYLDREPLHRPDGTWTYSYFQEGDSPADDGLYTNQGLKRCMEDGVPVGVARQISAKPNPTTYEILGIAKVSNWKGGFFQLDGYANDGRLTSIPLEGPLVKEISEIESENPTGSFEPTSQIDARDRVLSEIVRRRGQKAFRSKMLRIYGGRCSVCGCKVEAILEAAHITPYLGPETNNIGNGLLLRADLHTLWDLGLIAINTNGMKIWISPNLIGSEYEQFGGLPFEMPKNVNDWPSKSALDAHWHFASTS